MKKEITKTNVQPVYMTDDIKDEEFESIEPIKPEISADKMADLFMYLDRKADTPEVSGDPLTMRERSMLDGLIVRLSNEINIIGMRGGES